MTHKTLLFEMFPPTEELRQFINFYWIAKDSDTIYRCHILPNCHSNLVINRSGMAQYHLTQHKKYRDLSELLKQPVAPISSFIINPHIDYNIIETQNKLDIVGVHFTALGTRILNIRNNILSSITPNSNIHNLGELEKNIKKSTSSHESVLMLNEFFIKQLMQHEIDTYITEQLTKLETKTNITNIQNLANTICIGERQLQRLFNNYIGIKPSEYCRIQRFSTVLRMLFANKKSNNCLHYVAESNGYSDLSHMVRDFKQLSGMTPGYITASTGKVILDKHNLLMLQTD